MSKSADLNEALRVLSERYQTELPAKLAEIKALIDALSDTTNITAEAAHELHRLVHSLTGSGATFGLSALSNAARLLEATIKENLQESTSGLSGEVLRKIGAQWEVVNTAAYRRDSSPVLNAGNPANARSAMGSEEFSGKGSGNILLVEDDPEQAMNLQLQLGHFGYSVKVLHDTTLLNEAIAETAPLVIIMDVVFPEGNLAGPLTITGLSDEIKARTPVIFISSRGDIVSRLSAVRAGATAYFTKPVDIGMLIDNLDKLSTSSKPEAPKILIVDDSADLSSYYAMTLQSAGMETAVVTDPLKILDMMSEFTPELILVDMYMPGCNGLELAKIIRQQETFVSTPIVFLSAETDIEKHLEAMQFGADDFLTKPIQPAHLISSVTSRVQRYRVLRSFMVRDSLTGLLNHTKIKEELETEIIRAERQNHSLVFAMIDIDFFKRVNDSYGHLTGDRVIKSLARLLQQRLRKTDVVGRYGGEEFAVILKDTDAASGVAILESVRIAFEQIVQHMDSQHFSVTFSCGVAVFPQFSTATEINMAADRALYEAKNAGRNRVVIARKQ